ncbi:MAG: ATP-binding cassette domain-containing protein [Anaerovorax sp.]
MGEILKRYPYTEDFFTSYSKLPLNDLLSLTPETYFASFTTEDAEDFGISGNRLKEDLCLFIEKMELLKKKRPALQSITILGGEDKMGHKEPIELTIEKGNIIAIVGPTGSGKSCLLADIECLAQRDTQTKRQILVNGKTPNSNERFSLDNKLIAQLTQNMNFVMDLPVGQFIRLHGGSRMIKDLDEICKQILETANQLAGEPFTEETPLTSLSGGQSRALMIADTALLSTSPIILIDEIENAGVDRKKALELLVKKEKIVFLSTHDPILALMGHKRLIIKNGGIQKCMDVTEKERDNLETLEKIDTYMLYLREKIRAGNALDFDMKIQLLEEESYAHYRRDPSQNYLRNPSGNL